MDAPDPTVRRAAIKAQLGQALSPEEARRLAIRQGLEEENARQAGGGGSSLERAAERERLVLQSAMTRGGLDVRGYSGSMWAPTGSVMAPRALPMAEVAAARAAPAIESPDPAQVGTAFRQGEPISNANARPGSMVSTVDVMRRTAPQPGLTDQPDPRSVGRLLRGSRLDPEAAGVELDTARARSGLLANDLASAPNRAAYQAAQTRHLELQNERLATPETPFAPSVSLMTDPVTGEPISALLTSPRSAVPISKPAPRKAKTEDVRKVQIGTRNMFYHPESKRFFDEAGQPVNFPSGRAGDIEALLGVGGESASNAGGTTAGARPAFVEGNFYRDANGNRAKYLGGGRWEEAR